MHIVTSSVFNHSFVKVLTPASQSVLLRTWLSVIIAVWISRGRPAINIKNFYDCTPPHPQPPTLFTVTPDAEAVDPNNLNPNPWISIVQTTLQHPNEHFPKFQRTLALYAAWYDTTEQGNWKATENGLEGIELLDGTLFVRVAYLTANRLGWVREGQPKGEWDYNVF